MVIFEVVNIIFIENTYYRKKNLKKILVNNEYSP